MRENALVGFQEEKTDLSNRTSLTAPDGSITTYGYDTLNRLNGIANSWAGSFGFGYDALSRRTQLTRPNGVTSNYAYDSLSRLLSVLHQSGSTILDGASYTYDAAGNRLSKTNYLNGITEGYTYDNLYELTQVVQGATTTESYTYDPVGNRLSSLSVPLYNYNASNELTSTSLGSYSYDQNGNELADATGKSFTWDFENRLIQATVPQMGGGSTAVTFKYDPFGRRIQKSGPLGTTNYLYDRDRVITETNSSGVTVFRYANGRAIDESLAFLNSGAPNYYQQDGMNTILSFSSPSGAITGTYSYDSFGTVTSSTGTATNERQFTGREFDSETGLYYFRARYYDSQTGRFVSEDPIGFDGGTGFYTYVFNNPTNLLDPLGLKVYPPGFIGPLQPGDFIGPYTVDPYHNPILAPLAKSRNAHAPALIGDGQCVTFTRTIFPKLPCTRCWRAGPKVIDNDIPQGTAVATFDQNGRFPTDGDQNSGIYMGSQTYADSTGGYSTGIWLIDQFTTPYHPAQQRPLSYLGFGPNGGHERSNSANDYYEILVPAGTTPGGCDCGK